MSILNAETKVVDFERDNMISTMMVLDGGSCAYGFIVSIGGIEMTEYLFLDNAYVPVEWDHETKPVRFENKKDGLLYWSSDNFVSRTPLDVDSPLGTDLKNVLREWFTENGYENDIKKFNSDYPDLWRIMTLLKVPEAYSHPQIQLGSIANESGRRFSPFGTTR